MCTDLIEQEKALMVAWFAWPFLVSLVSLGSCGAEDGSTTAQVLLQIHGEVVNLEVSQLRSLTTGRIILRVRAGRRTTS